jgi:hypothetical protein
MIELKLPRLFGARRSEKIITSLDELNYGKQQLKDSIRAYRLADNMKELDFDKATDDEGFVKYEGILVKNHSTINLHERGITILEIKANEDALFDLHLHDNESQFIRVIKGKIADLKHNMIFSTNETYFVPKRQEHMIKYFKGTNAIIIYMPNLMIANKCQ